jgi:hypothetical protein
MKKLLLVAVDQRPAEIEKACAFAAQAQLL